MRALAAGELPPPFLSPTRAIWSQSDGKRFTGHWRFGAAPRFCIAAKCELGERGRRPEVGCVYESFAHPAPRWVDRLRSLDPPTPVMPDDGTARIWDAKSARLLRLIEAHAGGVSSLAISYDGKHLPTAGKDGYAKLWSIESGSLIGQNALGESVTSVSCSSIAPECAVAAGSRVVILSLNPVRPIRKLEGLNPVALRYMADDKHIVVSSSSRHLQLIDGTTGRNPVSVLRRRKFSQSPLCSKVTRLALPWLTAVVTALLSDRG